MMNDEWAGAIRAFMEWLSAADRSPQTREHRRYQLVALSRAFPEGPTSVTSGALTQWLGSHGWSTETMRNQRSAARSFFSWATAAGILPSDPSVVLPTIRRASHLPRPVSDSQWRALLHDPDTRISMIVQLGARLGLRRAEIAAVSSSDVLATPAGFSLVVVGKGRKMRTIPMPEDLARQVLAARGWVFPSPLGGHLTPSHIGVLLRHATQGEWVTHQLRHRFATVVYSASHDLVATQTLLGHASPQTTLGYVALVDDTLRSAAKAAA